jgi:hypothetical protein
MQLKKASKAFNAFQNCPTFRAWTEAESSKSIHEGEPYWGFRGKANGIPGGT